MKTETSDVLVIGAGPIGTYAAWRMAQAGLHVRCLERRTAQQPPSDIGLFHFERVAFDRTEVPLPKKKDLVCTYPGITVHTPDPDKHVWVDGIETWALDLNVFIRDLRRLAKQAGAVFRFGREARRLLVENGRVVGVAVQHGERSEEYRAAIVVDASGLHRFARRKMPAMNYPGCDKAFTVFMQYWRDAETKPGDGIHSYLGTNSWTARYPDNWIVGMGNNVPLTTLEAAHYEWTTRLFPGSTQVERSVAGTIPYSFPPPTLVDDGLIVIGDAAATNKPFNGEGIASGMNLAKIAAEEAPAALRAGADRRALWEINRRYFTDQGAKFAFLLAMGLSLIKLTDRELITAYDAGMFGADDLRQTFYNYEVKKPITDWALPLARLSRQMWTARKYAAAFLRATLVARHFENFPKLQSYAGWDKRFRKLVAPFT